MSTRKQLTLLLSLLIGGMSVVAVVAVSAMYLIRQDVVRMAVETSPTQVNLAKLQRGFEQIGGAFARITASPTEDELAAAESDLRGYMADVRLTAREAGTESSPSVIDGIDRLGSELDSMARLRIEGRRAAAEAGRRTSAEIETVAALTRELSSSMVRLQTSGQNVLVQSRQDNIEANSGIRALLAMQGRIEQLRECVEDLSREEKRPGLSGLHSKAEGLLEAIVSDDLARGMTKAQARAFANRFEGLFEGGQGLLALRARQVESPEDLAARADYDRRQEAVLREIDETARRVAEAQGPLEKEMGTANGDMELATTLSGAVASASSSALEVYARARFIQALAGELLRARETAPVDRIAAEIANQTGEADRGLADIRKSLSGLGPETGESVVDGVGAAFRRVRQLLLGPAGAVATVRAGIEKQRQAEKVFIAGRAAIRAVARDGSTRAHAAEAAQEAAVGRIRGLTVWSCAIVGVLALSVFVIGATVGSGIRRDILESEGYQHVAQTQLRQRQRELELLTEEANAANRAKTRFLANMSHEIRTPMNGVIGMIQLLIHTELSAEQQEYASVAQSSGESLLALIDNILDLSKIEAGKVVLENLSFDPRRTVTAVVQVVRGSADARGLSVQAQVAEEIPELLSGDAHRLRQVLTNLAANAIKFTERGGVTIQAALDSWREGKPVVRFSVTDTGIGLSQAQIQGLFSRFTQADVSTTRKYGGTGLGLAICSQLVELMGGNIGVDSREGEGSTFWFTAEFETSKAATRAETEQTERRSEARVRPGERVRGGRILVADDNATNRVVVLAQLKKLGYEASAVTTGAEAVEAIGRGEYDLILMDCHMPVMDGLEATGWIRRSEKANVPIVALTASAMSSDRDACLEAGMNDYLSKPLELSTLRDMLVKWLPLRADTEEAVPIVVAKEAGAGESRPDSAAADVEAGVFHSEALLERMMGDRELAEMVLKGFVDDMPNELRNLSQRLEESDAKGFRLHAHTFKGAAATIGAEGLYAIALALENAGNAGKLDECEELLPRAADEFDRFRNTLERAGWARGYNSGE